MTFLKLLLLIIEKRFDIWDKAKFYRFYALILTITARITDKIVRITELFSRLNSLINVYLTYFMLNMKKVF
jgi:hypothetical protein